jgi:hypothetical protein
MDDCRRSEDKRSVSLYRAVLRGASDEIRPESALVMLAKSDYPNRVRDIDAIVADARQPLDLRALAVERLGRIQHPAVPDALLRRLDTPEPQLRRRIVRRLSVSGDERALEPLLALAGREKGKARQRTLFAAGLIEHRLGRETSHLRLPEDIGGVACELRDNVFAAALRPPIREVEACVLDLADEPNGLQYDEESAIEIRIDAERWMLLLDSRLRDAAETARLECRCALWGVLAEWDRVSGTYALSSLILSSPGEASTRPRLHMYDPDGDLLAAGDAPCAANGGVVSLRTVAKRLGLAFEFGGVLIAGRLEVGRSRAMLTESRKRTATALSMSPIEQVR